MAASQDEVISALSEYFRVGLQNRDWDAWVERFTDDAVVVDRHGAEHRGPEAIGEWLANEKRVHPSMTFSVEWVIVDEERAAFWMWSHLPDPEETEYGYDIPELVVLTYAGDERWSRAEVFANPEEAQLVLADWEGAGGTDETPADPSLVAAAPAHPEPPSPGPDRGVLEAVCDALVTENWLDLIETGGAEWHDHGGFGILRWADGERSEQLRILDGSRAVIVLEAPLRAALVAHVNEHGRVTYLDHVYDSAQLPELSATS